MRWVLTNRVDSVLKAGSIWLGVSSSAAVAEGWAIKCTLQSCLVNQELRRVCSDAKEVVDTLNSSIPLNCEVDLVTLDIKASFDMARVKAAVSRQDVDGEPTRAQRRVEATQTSSVRGRPSSGDAVEADASNVPVGSRSSSKAETTTS
ncbi:hypothetical protein Scep_021710 [Stephania cephalantha]|uniref:RNase H type-1 domain-containing protein n=1 Tax=Stephania cephalantha TaxID=152367 RepID=A0AAP0I1L6_9MAGN